MCGRITLPGTSEILAKLPLKFEGDSIPAQINVPPSLKVPLITSSKPDSLQYFTWSIIPAFSETGKVDFKLSTFNATIEKLHTSPMWKPLFGRRHCVVITSGFYEWHYGDPIKKKNGTPHLIRAKADFTYMAGLWTAWKHPQTSEFVPSCTIITLPANQLMASIHNTKGRMPAFLTQETSKVWLANDLSAAERRQALEPVSDDFLEVFPVKKVGDEEEYKKLMGIC